MSRVPENLVELEDLLGALRDGTVTDEQIARLDGLLATNPAARRFYVEYWDLCSTLRHYQGKPCLDAGGPGTEGLPVSTGAPAPAAQRFGRLRVRWARLAIAAGLVLGVGIGLLELVRRDRPPPRSDSDPQYVGSGGVAVLTRTLGAQWQTPQPPPALGASLPQSRLRLISGLVQLEFYSGATVILEGPADFELLATDRAFCRQGKLRAKVQPSAHGFSIDTPHGRLVDLGTEFGVNVEKSGVAQLRVFDGKVEVHTRDDAPAPQKQEVTRGNGVLIDSAGIVRPRGTQPESFIGVVELERRWTQEARRRYQTWSVASEKLRVDPHVLLYYSFEGQERWDRTVFNQTRDRKPALDGAVIGCQWIEGRWPGKGALDFKRPSDRIRFHLPGQFNALTLMTWVRVDALDQRYNALMLTDGFELGAPHWQINGQGQIQLGVCHQPDIDWRSRSREGGFHNYFSDRIFEPDQLGQWKHLVVVYDANAGFVAHYVNGERAGQSPLMRNVTLSVGNAEIGNWGVPLSGDHNPVRNLNGRMDEFVVFDRALSAEEVRALYVAGEPIH